MNNIWDEVVRALVATRELDNAVKANGSAMAQLLVGRLRHVKNEFTLAQLKRELRAYNPHTKAWKEIK